MSSVANILNRRTEGSFWTPSAGEQGQTASQSERANTHRDFGGLLLWAGGLGPPVLSLRSQTPQEQSKWSVASSCSRMGTDFLTALRWCEHVWLPAEEHPSHKRDTAGEAGVGGGGEGSRQEVGLRRGPEGRQYLKRPKKCAIVFNFVNYHLLKTCSTNIHSFNRNVPVVRVCWQICLDKLAF